MTAGQFAEERFIPKISPQIKKRNDELLRALGVVVADENTDIEATIKKYAKRKNKKFYGARNNSGAPEC